MIEFELVKGPQDGGRIRFDHDGFVLKKVFVPSSVCRGEYVSWKEKETRGYCACYVKVDKEKFEFRS